MTLSNDGKTHKRPHLAWVLWLAIPSAFIVVLGGMAILFLSMRVVLQTDIASIASSAQKNNEELLSATITSSGTIEYNERENSVTEEYLSGIREVAGFDDPLIVQYGIYVRAVLNGDLGYLFWQRDRYDKYLYDKAQHYMSAQ